ncbi:MAG: CHAD domain-containing protein, partial [Nocardioides sp.]
MILEDALAGRVAELVAQTKAADRLVADGHPEGVHDLRVALRRLRSLLTSYRRPLGWADNDALRGELRRAGTALSGLRDLEVVLERLAGHPATAEIEQHVREALTAEVARVDRLREGEGCSGLLVTLEGLPGRPVSGRAEPAGLLGREWRRLARRVEGAGLDDPEALHQVRKAAKRARYAAETLVPVLGDRAQRVADLAREAQEALGDHRDAWLVRGAIGRLRHLLADPAAADRVAGREEAA